MLKSISSLPVLSTVASFPWSCRYICHFFDPVNILLFGFPKPLAPGSDIQIHVNWGTRLDIHYTFYETNTDVISCFSFSLNLICIMFQLHPCWNYTRYALQQQNEHKCDILLISAYCNHVHSLDPWVDLHMSNTHNITALFHSQYGEHKFPCSDLFHWNDWWQYAVTFLWLPH